MEPTVSRYYHLDVEVSPERIGQVERILAAHLRHWGLRSLVDPVCHSSRLLLGAIDTHGPDRTAVVEMWWAGRHLVTAVSDRNRAVGAADPEHSAHLLRVAEWSDGWGRYPGPSGTTVWFSCKVRTADPVPVPVAVPVAG
jgi:hypothetical protein